MSKLRNLIVRNVLQINGDSRTVGATAVTVLFSDSSDLVLLARGTSVPTGAGYAKGCIFAKTDAGAGVKALYENIGTSAAANFNLMGDVTASEIAAGSISGAKLNTGKGYFTVTVATNNTTPVDVFGAGGVPCDLIVKHVRLTAKDATASNITVATDGNTIATIAKGTSAGALVGATSIANGAIAAAGPLTIVSSGAGEAFVEIAFEVA